MVLDLILFYIHKPHVIYSRIGSVASLNYFIYPGLI